MDIPPRGAQQLPPTSLDDTLVLDLPFQHTPPRVAPTPLAPADPAVAGDAAVAGDPDSLGCRVTRRFLHLCENPRTRERTMRVLRSSADSAVGGRMLVAFLSRMVFSPALRSRRIDHATARIELACAQLGGIAVLRYVTRMEPVASLDVEDVVRMVGPAVHLTLTSPYARVPEDDRRPPRGA